MGELKKSAEYVCVATGQIGLDYSTNEYGPGPQVYAKFKYFPKTVVDWKESAFETWLENKDYVDVMVLRSPTTRSVVYDEAMNQLVVEMVRLHTPGPKDYEEYAAKCGCESSDEAVRIYGDLQWCCDTMEVLVKGTEVRQFLDYVVPYCWNK